MKLQTRTRIVFNTTALFCGLCFILTSGATPSLADASEQVWTDGQRDSSRDDAPLTFSTFADVAEQVSPAVVNISVIMQGQPRPGAPGQGVGQGTGFLINADGLIVTNNHVIDGYREITVRLADRREFRADVIGTDPRTDLALIKIKVSEEMPFLRLGDSSAIRVGDWVMAVGNPLGLDHTVTVGIISAVGRRGVRPEGREMLADFLQTDASINPGNSGGPLLDVNGNVIGVATAISRSANNIGFAIPVDMLKVLLPQLVRGEIVRSWLGVSVGEITPNAARQLGLARPRGAMVGEVIGGSPAARAGLRRGDVILRFDGTELEDFAQLPWLASVAGVGRAVRMEVLRGGQRFEVEAELTEQQARASGVLGIDVAAANILGGGVQVTSVTSGSSAARAGVLPGDLILGLDGRRVAGVAEWEAAVRGLLPGKLVKLAIRRGRLDVYISFFV